MMKLFSRHLFRGDRPKSADDLISWDIKTIIDLETGAYELTHDDWYEHATLSRYGIDLIRIPCSNFGFPRRTFVEWANRVMATERERGQNVLVHCLHGKDRTGFVVAMYRMHYEGWSYGLAVREMFKEGFHWLPYLWWLIPLYAWRKK